MSEQKQLLAIIELGGYPNLMLAHQRSEFRAGLVTTQRKVKAWLKRQQSDMVVAEYNYQTDFRDRSSNLETLTAVLQRYPDVKLLVLYPPEHAAVFDNFRKTHKVWKTVAFPITEQKVTEALSDLAP